jgi:hypothetical protein
VAACRTRSYDRSIVTEADVFAEFPSALPASTAQPGLLYRRVPELIAFHDPAATPAGWEVVLTLDQPRIVVCRGDAHALPSRFLETTVTPVYALTGRAGPAVPTGLVLVRFREGVVATQRGDALAHEGFAIQDLLPYAPSAAWVRAASGGIPAALRRFPALASLADVVHVEPQMLRRAARR